MPPNEYDDWTYWSTRLLVGEVTRAYYPTTPNEQQQYGFRLFLMNEQYLTEDMDDG